MPQRESQAGATRRFARVRDRFASPRDTRDAEDARELQTECVDVGATPVAQVADRTYAKVAGTLRTVTLRPVGGVPALEAELYDGSGIVTLVWLGRRRLAAIEPGRWLVASGLIADHEGRRLMYNPRYELRAMGHG